ncbi:MAG TPA: CHAD domain-containing protein [Bryobacteraceae bacterium]|jgi:CHAD domain-containing protein|nr:CHAD domain-containing protein [Bryobacteraceae bacterium]
MGYRLEADESVPKGLRRLIREEIESSGEYLAGNKPGGPDEAIHEARKSIKKIRAVLRLVQPELGAIYDKENTALGTVAADLSEIRDAAAILETFDTLPGSDEFGPVRHALAERKKQTDASKDRDAVIQEAALGLRKLEKRIKTWPLKTGGFGALAPGLELRYRRGRRAMKAAGNEQTPECFHEWRKRVKDHWYQVRLIESLWTDEMQARERSLKELETWLGDDHNLFVMRSLIAGEPAAFGEPAMVDALLDLIDKRQNELRRNSLSLGARLYDDKPKAFTRRIEHLWKEWQSRPKDLEKQEVDAAKGDSSPRKPAAKAGRSPRGRARIA